MTQIETAKRNSAIVKMAKEGKTADEIAKILNIKRQRVLQITRSHNLKLVREYKGLNSVLAKNIITELQEGKKQSDISRDLKVSRQYVSQIKQRCLAFGILKQE